MSRFVTKFMCIINKQFMVVVIQSYTDVCIPTYLKSKERMTAELESRVCHKICTCSDRQINHQINRQMIQRKVMISPQKVRFMIILISSSSSLTLSLSLSFPDKIQRIWPKVQTLNKVINCYLNRVEASPVLMLFGELNSNSCSSRLRYNLLESKRRIPSHYGIATKFIQYQMHPQNYFATSNTSKMPSMSSYISTCCNSCSIAISNGNRPRTCTYFFILSL